MENFIKAYEGLLDGFQEVLSEMKEEQKIKGLSIMANSLGTPEFPFLEIYIDEPFKNIQDSGLSEIFEGELIVSSQVLNNTNPVEGIHEATMLVSEVRDRILKSRLLKKLGIYFITTSDLGWVPFGFGKKRNIYSAGVTFKIRFKLSKPKCNEQE